MIFHSLLFSMLKIKFSCLVMLHYVAKRMLQFLSSGAFRYKDTIFVHYNIFFLPEVLDFSEKLKEN